MRRLGLLLTFSALLPAQNSVELLGRYWIPDMGSRIRVQAAGAQADIDARNDLGMSNENFPEAEVRWQRGRNRLHFHYTPIEFSADQTVLRTLLFRGREYTVGARVVSDLEARHLQLGWSYQFLNVHEGVFRLGPLVEANGFLLRGSLAAPALGAQFQQAEDLKAGLPTIGFALDIQPHRAVDIYSRTAGMKAGDYGYFIGSDSGVKVSAWRHLVFTGGYRTFNLHVQASNDFARLRLRGPFVGAGFRF